MSKKAQAKVSKKTAPKKGCWIATEVKGGFRLKLSYGPRDYNLKGLILKSYDEVEFITSKLATVYVHLRDTKFQPK